MKVAAVRPAWIIAATLAIATVSSQAATRFVAPNGADAGHGGRDAPFRTLQRCSDASRGGDRCLVATGRYRETVLAKSSVSFEPLGASRVTVDGTDMISGWRRFRGAIYRAHLDQLASSPELQLFADHVMLPQARWPNAGPDPMRPHWATMGQGTSSTRVVAAAIPAIDWRGATLHIFSGTNPFAHQTATVIASEPGSVTTDFTNSDVCPFLCAMPGGHFYLVGAFAALDAPGEWYYDANARMLYLWPPKPGVPHGVTIKRRSLGIDLRGRSDVTIRNFAIFATSIAMDGQSSGNLLDGLDLRYVSHFETLPRPDPADLAYSEGGWDVVASHQLDSGVQLF